MGLSVRTLVASSSAQVRLLRAVDWLAGRATSESVLIIGASLDAASELLRNVASHVPAAFGWERITLGRLAALVAGKSLYDRGLSPLSPLGAEAVCTRLIYQLGAQGNLGRLQPIWRQPGLPQALSRTLQELRLAESRPSGDLAKLLEAYEAELLQAGLADRAEVFRLALQTRPHPFLGYPALLLDLPLHTQLEVQLVGRLSGPVFATEPTGDERSLERLSRALGVPIQRLDNPQSPSSPDQEEFFEHLRDSSLSRVQKYLFREGTGDHPAADDSVTVLSAPGESRECIEIARRVMQEADRGLPFDRMAILLRSPSHYRALLEEAVSRAGVPAHFAQGTVRPDPAGRAFLALLACAAEGLSAGRFAEYLSLGEVPKAVAGAPPPPAPRAERWTPPDTELSPSADPTPEEIEPAPPDDLEAPVVAGSLRAPRRWEKILLDAAVIGGRDRWERRLAGLERELQTQMAALPEEEARAARVRRDLADLRALREFSLPLLDAVDALPRQALWGQWLDQLSALATQAVREPTRILSVLAELAPMAPVGPATLEEVRLVLARRLTALSQPPTGNRYGKVFVAPVEAARGLSFDVVFVPGLAERLFPQKVAQDPLLRDLERADLHGLDTNQERVLGERLALRLAAGAAHRKLVLSWPRIDTQQARVRVPSFYGVEVLRAAEGILPGFSELMRRAEEVGAAHIGWPAPADPAQAIDDAEHDLSLLKRVFNAPASARRGTGHYLLGTNPHLQRALRSRARRWLKRWTQADGLVDPSPEALAALAAHAPSLRPFSPTALQDYAACPYRFLLRAVHRLAPREVPEAIDEIDPLSRGSMVHEVQFELLRALQESGALPLSIDRLDQVSPRLDKILEGVAARWKDELSPAIPRIWDDSIAAMAADLREWLHRVAQEPEWVPWRFELSFGLPDLTHHDPHSSKEPITLAEGLRLRGSIDLVERRGDGALRATDHKSGRQRCEQGVVIGGGMVLQPALYALALQKLFPDAPVHGGRLYYCTFTGGFEPVEVPLDELTRSSVRELSKTIAEAIAQGFIPAAPNRRECTYCDFLPVCGPNEEDRITRKPTDRLQALTKLRGLS
jgi:CRISPR/Cas system-associated exonuclease Cas4 (RecB family)